MGQKQMPYSGIRTLPEHYRGTTASSLASDTVIILDTSYGSALARDFLWKRARMQASLRGMNANEVVIMGFARGDMTTTEIAVALATQLVNPDDFNDWAKFANANGIYWQTLVQGGSGNGQSGSGTGLNIALFDLDTQIGGKHGIPVEGGVGVSLFVFNPMSNALGTGVAEQGLYQLIGVFLETE